jgi:phosphohistidine phosphatase
MEVYVLRHGIAEDAARGQSDDDRSLTDEGRKKLTAVMERAAAAEVEPTLILTSPLKRAVQTAEIAAKVLGHTSPLVRTDALIPGSSPQKVWNVIREHRDEAAILLAGHEPLLSHLVSYLLSAPALQVDMKKAGLVRIDMDSFRGEPHGILKWMIVPKLA